MNKTEILKLLEESFDYTGIICSVEQDQLDQTCKCTIVEIQSVGPSPLIKKNSPMLCVGVSDEMSFPQMRESK